MMLPEPGTILIVDDDRGGREALEALLLSQGYNLVLASNGADALQKLVEVPIDLIMLDIMMPGMDGYEVCRRIRNTPAIADIPILILTAMNDFRSRLAGFEVGADDYITKPYDSMELFARVRTVSRLNRFRRLVAERVKFQQLFELSPNGQLVIDVKGVVQLTNKKILQLVNIDGPEEIVGSDLVGWIKPDRQPEFKALLAEFWKDPSQTCHHETWLAGKNQLVQPVEIVLGQIEFNGEVMAQVIAVDIRERMQLTGALAKERTLLKALMDTFPDFVYCKDLESRFLMVNPAMAQFFGIGSPEDAIGRTDFDFYPRELAIRYFSDEQYLLKDGKPVLEQEEAMVDANGTWHWVSTLKAPLHNRSGELIGIIGIGRDITRQRNALTELADAQIELGIRAHRMNELNQIVSNGELERVDYLSYLGSELNLLGDAIIDNARLLGQSQDPQPQAAERIQKHAQELIDFTQDIIEYSRLAKRDVRPESLQISLSEWIEAAQQRVRDAASQKGLLLTIKVDDKLPGMAVGDSSGLSQVLVRLLLNAIHSTDAGEVSMMVEMENYSLSDPNELFYIHVVIRDSGPGIAKEEMDGLFKPFRIPSKNSTLMGASGLNLTICQLLVELSEGRIWAESEGIPGKGSAFHFTAQLRAA